MLIPNKVKIKGRPVSVTESGRGYVYVGESFAELTPEQKDKAENDPVLWREYMYEAFLQALQNERNKS